MTAVLAFRVAKSAAEFQKFFKERHGDDPIRCPFIRKLFADLDAWKEASK